MDSKNSAQFSMVCGIVFSTMSVQPCFVQHAKAAGEEKMEITKNPRKFVEKYLCALRQSDWKLAASMCRPGSKQARNAHRLGDMCDFTKSQIGIAFSSGQAALAITKGLTQKDNRKWQLAFALRRKGVSWVLKDIDWVPPGKDKDELQKFLKVFPGAKPLGKAPGREAEKSRLPDNTVEDK